MFRLQRRRPVFQAFLEGQDCSVTITNLLSDYQFRPVCWGTGRNDSTPGLIRTASEKASECVEELSQ